MDDKIRIIVQSSEGGTIEYVRFIDDPDDIKELASYFAYNGCTIDSDNLVDRQPWMDSFPMNYSLRRE